ncbi:uncharacterized protein PAC_01406 [Phialocephala subalpina]|uniref:Uncharacterized protein n=1 Tax=Phialocephala subalpina TaxID=576137 RepID=A0A1L7WFK8_9HELO|nr:uncharacterized protein PAC_01406 [Phialocephala subalpina]
MTSSRKAGSLRKDREHGRDHGGSTTKDLKQLRTKSTAKDKTKKHSENRAQETKLPIQECECVPTSSRKVPPRRKSMRYVPHAYTPFHHISLNVMDGLTDDDEAVFGIAPDHTCDDIGDESTTILTPSYDTTSLSSTIPTYFDEDDDFVIYSRSDDPYSNTAHDLKCVGHWAEMDERWDMLPSYMNVMSLNRRYTPRREVREVMVGIDVAFLTAEQSQANVYGTGRHKRRSKLLDTTSETSRARGAP